MLYVLYVSYICISSICIHVYACIYLVIFNHIFLVIFLLIITLYQITILKRINEVKYFF